MDFTEEVDSCSGKSVSKGGKDRPRIHFCLSRKQLLRLNPFTIKDGTFLLLAEILTASECFTLRKAFKGLQMSTRMKKGLILQKKNIRK